MTDPHAPLRENIHLLGDILGETLRREEGGEVFAIVEGAREMAKAAREGDPKAEAELADLLAGLPVKRAIPVARAFAHFLTLANIAEQHHRVRRRRAYLLDTDAPPQRGSLDETLPRLLARGVSPEALREMAAAMRIDLVLTAHPTEVTRRTLITKQKRVAEILEGLDRPDLTRDERRVLVDNLRRVVLTMWRTTEIRHKKPTPEDEARAGYALVEQVLWDALPLFLRRLDESLRKHAGGGLPVNVAPIRFGSWMGGDRDGNPNVTPEVTRRVVLMARWSAADLFLRDIESLRGELSLAEGSAELQARVATTREPYRALLRDVRDKLRATLATLEEALAEGKTTDVNAYLSTQDLLEPLQLCDRSLRDTGAADLADGHLADTLRRAACFGLGLVRLDLRQESDRHADAVDALAKAAGHASYLSLSEEKKQAFLAEALTAPASSWPAPADASAEVRDVLETFEVAAELPAENRGTYVISMARAPSDALAVAFLQRRAGVEPPMRVAPLFETLDDLQHAGQTMRALFASPTYRALCEDGAEVMIGYSDSAKDAGTLAAAWALFRAQEDVLAAGEAAGVRITLFHGRGGTVGRGGGPAYAAILSQPPGSVGGRIRVTEQGEVIQARFGLPGIAQRSLELYATAVLDATLTPAEKAPREWREEMDAMARTASESFRGVVRGESRFVEYFQTATPVGELGLLNIGSRPAKRKPTGGLESLRAIPWIFGWTQNRLNLPAWLGVDDALAAGRARDAKLVERMARDWPFFRTHLDLLEMALAKADVRIAARYEADLVEEDLKELGATLRARFDRTVAETLAVTGHKELIQSNPVLRRSIRVRNPYVDPLNHLQIQLLRRVRSGEDGAMRDALLLTINGIAYGMRNTG